MVIDNSALISLKIERMVFKDLEYLRSLKVRNNRNKRTFLQFVNRKEK